MAHIHNVFDTEPRYAIDPVKRLISHLTKDEEVVVQGDHNSERFAFEVPRFIDGHDMSLCNQVRVHYINIGGSNERKADVYEVDDMQIDPENSSKILCSWLISSNATTFAGSLSFALQFKCLDGNGETTYAWNTQPYTGVKVTNGINNGEAVVGKWSDILDEWYETLVSSGDEGINKVEAATNEALVRIEEESSAFANAIKNTVSGEALRIDGVSPISHPVKVQLKSKNLFDISQIAATSTPGDSNIYFSEVGENYIVITSKEGYDSGGYKTSGKKLRELCPGMEVGKTYTLSGTTQSNVDNYVYIGETWKYGDSKVITQAMLDYPLVFYGLNSINNEGYGDCRIENIQIEEGEYATDYVAHVRDFSSVTVRACGKNMFNINEVDKFFDKTSNQGSGIASVVDGVIINHMGTYGNLIMCNPNIKNLPKGTYTLSFDAMCGRTTGVKHLRVIVQFKDGAYEAIVNKTLADYQKWEHFTGTMTLTEDKELWGIGFQNGGEEGDYTNLDTRFKNILLEYADSDTGYTSYVGGVHISPADGSLSIPSISPTMTLFTDTAGVIVNAEYNRDIGHYFQELKNLIAAGGGMSDITLADTVTGEFYKLTMVNGKLTLDKWEV